MFSRSAPVCRPLSHHSNDICNLCYHGCHDPQFPLINLTSVLISCALVESKQSGTEPLLVTLLQIVSWLLHVINFSNIEYTWMYVYKL